MLASQRVIARAFVAGWGCGGDVGQLYQVLVEPLGKDGEVVLARWHIVEGVTDVLEGRVTVESPPLSHLPQQRAQRCGIQA
ncbi:hypothetical protein OG985_48055 [Streptomyces sp. NBC_00289]|uniref:hypothetical protein n=1 Tax=Streptomyces sp. NBC_00289 TaxID=2975703 RepID=UPI00325166E3